MVRPLSREERIARCGPGAIIWLTGLPAAGKTTVAIHLERALFEAGRPVVRMDGDELRRGLCHGLGFNAEDRAENIRRAASVAALFADAGIICIAAFISPFRSDRARARSLAGPNRFLEVHVATPVEVCRARDPKGNYARASRGELPGFTGVSAPYEAPEAPDLVLHPERESVGEAVTQILAALAR